MSHLNFTFDRYASIGTVKHCILVISKSVHHGQLFRNLEKFDTYSKSIILATMVKHAVANIRFFSIMNKRPKDQIRLNSHYLYVIEAIIFQSKFI